MIRKNDNVAEEDKALFSFWDKLNEAMCLISDMTHLAYSNTEIMEHIKNAGAYNESKEPINIVIDYITKMFDE